MPCTDSMLTSWDAPPTRGHFPLPISINILKNQAGEFREFFPDFFPFCRRIDNRVHWVMITGLLFESLPPSPALLQPAPIPWVRSSQGTLVAKECREVSRWYAWTQCGNTTCCKLFIACSDGTVVSQTVDAGSCK